MCIDMFLFRSFDSSRHTAAPPAEPIVDNEPPNPRRYENDPRAHPARGPPIKSTAISSRQFGPLAKAMNHWKSASILGRNRRDPYGVALELDPGSPGSISTKSSPEL